MKGQTSTQEVVMGNTLKITAVLLIAGLLSLYNPAQAFARGDRDDARHGYSHSRSYPYGRLTFGLPHGAISIGFGKQSYFYESGLFYRSHRQREYIVVPPPSGIVVYALPAQYNQVVIDGTVYYTYNGVYYSRVAQGYQVVPPPPVVVDAATVSAVSTSSAPDEEEVFTVNIPLAKGGYKAVVIKRDGEGFQGPQGEFYPEFPKVQQLKVMYAK
jgi:hypothetical protein